MFLRRIALPTALALAGLGILGAQGSVAKQSKPKPVSVYPSPGTPVASDSTTFSFRGLKPKNLGNVRIYGSRSGPHRTRRVAHSDGRGVSLVPRRRFSPGETVSVFSGKRIRGARHGDFQVGIGRFFSRGRKVSEPKAKNRFPRLKSRPDLRPPWIRVRTNRPGVSPGQMLFAPKQTGLVIADRLGRINWFQPTGFGGRGQEVQDFRIQRFRGKPVLTFWKGELSRDRKAQVGTYNVINRAYKPVARFGAGNGYKPDSHEFKITSRNTALVIAYRSVHWDLRKFGGGRSGKVFDNVVQEIDIRTGAVLFEWHSLGNVRLKASTAPRPTNGDSWDYFHANSVERDGDSYLVSARKTCTIYRIARKSAQLKWRLRGDGKKSWANDFRVGPGARFGYQHDVQRLPNGDISLFDNGLALRFPNVRNQSSALVLRLRGKGKKSRAKPVQRFQHRPDPVIARSQGSAEVLANGNVFVGWGDKPQITEFSSSGDIVFDAVFGTRVNSYRARKAEWVGRPRTRPAIASRKTKKGVYVWASWNGMSGIASWRVMSGPDRTRLQPAGSSPWRGLETAIPVKKTAARYRVQALDAKGKILGKSAPVRAGRRAGGSLGKK